MSLLSWTKRELQRLDLSAKKGLGQHFMVNERVLHRMISSAGLTAEDTVVEVGPGLGTLTRELAWNAGHVIAVEVDTAMVAILHETIDLIRNVDVINADILEHDPESLVEADTAYKVVGALPYNIASAVLRHFLEAKHKPELMVVALQKEVAQAIAAQPGKMSLLSVSVQLYAKPTIVEYVAARSFYPAPKVESAVVRLDVYANPIVEVEDEATFFDVVRGGFATPRKQLHNSLSNGLQIAAKEATAVLERAGISPRRRAETLSIEEWAQVYRAYTETR